MIVSPTSHFASTQACVTSCVAAARKVSPNWSLETMTCHSSHCFSIVWGKGNAPLVTSVPSSCYMTLRSWQDHHIGPCWGREVVNPCREWGRDTLKEFLAHSVITSWNDRFIAKTLLERVNNYSASYTGYQHPVP